MIKNGHKICKILKKILVYEPWLLYSAMLHNTAQLLYYYIARWAEYFFLYLHSLVAFCELIEICAHFLS